DEDALTGAIGPGEDFPAGDFRTRYFRDDRRLEAARRAEALCDLLGEEAATLPELALRFILSRAEVTTVIPGMRRPEHAKANASVSDGRALFGGRRAGPPSPGWENDWSRG